MHRYHETVSCTEYRAPQRGLCTVFCIQSSLPHLSPQPPRQCLGPTCHLSTLNYSNTVSPVSGGHACPYDWRGFVRSKKKTSVGLLVFNPLWCTPSVAHQHNRCHPRTLPHPSTVGQLITHSPILIVLVTSCPVGLYLPLWLKGNGQNNMSKDDIVTWGHDFYRYYSTIDIILIELHCTL
jgi:hypothetical protein